MINSEMLEGIQGFATLEDVDQGTMTRFIEWLYRGYYHAAAPTKVFKPKQESSGFTSERTRGPSGGTTSPAEPSRGPWTLSNAVAARALQNGINAHASASREASEEAFFEAFKNSLPRGPGPDVYGIRTESRHSATPKDNPTSSLSRLFETHKPDPHDLFLGRKYRVRQTVKHLPPPRRPNISKTQTEDFSDVFLCHASLHVFADKYDIQTLKILALEELHATLAVFTLCPERTADILTLLRYVYTEAPEQADKMEDLRTLMIHYVESEFRALVRDEGLGVYLLEDNREFLEDFLRVVRKRLG